MFKFNEDEFLDDLEQATNAPKWILPFRKKVNEGLPFLIAYQAVAITRNKGSDVYRNKQAGIAIATKQLQAKGYLLENSNRLSALGDIREIAVLRRLGKEKAKRYYKTFENL